MSLIIQHLREYFPELPPCSEHSSKHWTFDASLKTMPSMWYGKLLPFIPRLSVEYSILCTQLRQDLLVPKNAKKEHVVARLTTALMLCELLEHVHLHYLNVPREVFRLRKQQEVFRALLYNLDHYTFATHLKERPVMEVGLSLSHQVRELTFQSNWYRIISNRSARVLNLLSTVLSDTNSFKQWIGSLEFFTIPFLAYFGLFFHLPRLLTNSFLMLKHTIPGFWMSNEEYSLNWTVRLQAQWQRRWFELSNDAVWTVLPALNLFLFIGALASGGVYLSTIAFAFDAINAAIRAYVELQRLYTLRREYQALLVKERDQEEKKFISNHLQHINKRIEFEQFRLGIHVSGTVLIFAAMSLAMPFLGVGAPVLLGSAVFLVLLWGITFELTRRLEQHRPKESIEIPVSVAKLSFFPSKPTPRKPYSNNPPPLSLEVDSATDTPPVFP